MIAERSRGRFHADVGHLSADGVHELVKPRLRGVIHQVAFFLALVAGAGLLLVARSPRGVGAGLIYGVSLVVMYGVSAAYHRASWSEQAKVRMRRLDHAGIFLLIAGTYTPVAWLGVPGREGTILLWCAWIGAGLGVLHSLFFVHAFRALNALLFVLFGCMAVPVIPAVVHGLGSSRALLIFGGGVVYIAGALVYGKRWPNPSPAVFGYHEVFHGMVVLASALHFAAVLSLLQQRA